MKRTKVPVMEMEKLVSLCKRRGFMFQSSEIYGGLNGFWDYGPLGVELKRNVKEAWWQDMVTGHDDLAAPAGAPEAYEMTGLDCSIIMHPAGLESARAITICSTISWSIAANRKSAIATIKCADGGCEAKRTKIFVTTTAEVEKEREDDSCTRLKFFKLRDKNDARTSWNGDPNSPLPTVKELIAGAGPDAKELGTLTEPREFNLMFKTYVGALERRRRGGLSATGNGPRHLRQLQERGG